jgi:hypothetical protein
VTPTNKYQRTTRTGGNSSSALLYTKESKLFQKKLLQPSFLLAVFHLVPFEVICGVVATKLRRLHSASTWPPFRLCAHSVASKSTQPPRQTFGQRTGTVSQKTGLPQDTLATELRHRCTPPSLPLHSAGKVSSLRGIGQRDQSGHGFSAVLAPNPKPLSSRRAGAPTTHLALNNIRSHHWRLNFETVAWHPMRMLLARTPHPLTFRKVFWPCTGQPEISG